MSKPENSVDCVLDRMVETMLGEDAHFKSHALALGIPHNTIRTWKRRGKVPLYELEIFSERYGVTIDWLLHGDQPEAAQAEPHHVSENVQPYGLSADEAALLETYREIDAEARVTLQNLLKVIAGTAQVAAPSAPPKPPKRIPRAASVRTYSSDLPDKKFTPPGGKRKKDSSA